MNSQQQRLENLDGGQQIWATMKYDELVQDIVQNFLLFKKGYVPALFVSLETEEQFAAYKRRLKFKFDNGIVDEAGLRLIVITMLSNFKNSK